MLFPHFPVKACSLSVMLDVDVCVTAAFLHLKERKEEYDCL